MKGKMRIINLALILLNVVVILDLCNGSFDLEYPIVLSDSFSSSESHFGYSVTLMKSTHPASVKGWILIGAPKSNSTDPTYHRNREIQEPGVVWRCSLGEKRGNETCEILNLDPIPNKHGECNYQRCQDFPQLDSKYENWLGGSMSSVDDPSGKFVTCAHRWTRGNFTLINGICYFLPAKDVNRYFDGNSAPLVDQSTYSHRLVPFFEKGQSVNQYFEYNLGETVNVSVKWAFGQAGISTHMARHDTGIELLLGAPGLYVWSGAVIRYRDGRPDPGSTIRRNRKDTFETDFASYSISTRPFSPSNWHDYFGYAVTSGKFDSTGQVLYVGGAPRGGSFLNGEVVVFKIPLDSKRDEIYTLRGQQIGSYFGSVLLAMDINGDGLDELFIAAPLLSWEIRGKQRNSRSLPESPDAITNNSKYSESEISSGDQGCVYIYSGEKQLKGEVEPYKLFGDESQSTGSRFGSAMTSLSDINGDGVNDFAIGAPYENDGIGAVYIYYGSRDNIPQLHQKITPKVFSHLVSSTQVFRGFGCSFSSGNDIDGNGTPDLAIGSYTSNKAVVFRTRPVIEIKGDIKFTIRNNIKVEVLRRGERTFNINSGVTFIPRLGRSQETLKVLVVLTFDANYDRFAITSTSSGPTIISEVQNEWQYEDRISARQDGGLKYYSFKAQLIKEHNESDPNLPAFIVQQTVIYQGLETPKPKKARQYEILGNRYVRVDGFSFDDFCSTCVGSGETKSDFPLVLSNEECIGSDCTPKLVGEAAFRLPGKGNSSRIKEFLLGSSNEVVLDIVVKNKGQTATKPLVTISWQKPQVQISRLPPGCTGPKNTHPGTLLTCSLGDYLRNNKEQAVEVVFNMADIFASQAVDEFPVEVEILTLQDKDRHLHTKIFPKLKLTAEAKVRIFGSPHKNIMWTSKFRHTYEVQLEGPSSMATVMMGFKIPVNKTIEGVHRQILLLSQPDYGQYNCIVRRGAYEQIETTTTIPVLPGEDNIPGPGEGGGGRPTPPDVDYDGENEVELAKRVGIPRRQKRDTLAPRNLAMKKRKKVTVDSNTLGFSCNDLSDQSVQCMEVECTVKNVKSGILLNIVFDFTIVNETAYKLLQSVEKDSLLIESTGTASTHSPASKDDDISQTTLETLAPKEVAVYIYILAVIGGIVLLVVLTTILYKVGFFKRETKKQLDELKAARDDARQSLLMAAGRDEQMQTYQGYDQSQLPESQTQVKGEVVD